VSPGTVSIRASVLKDGHVFSIHILNPKQPGEEDEDESLLPPNPSKNEVGQEKSETERSEKEGGLVRRRGFLFMENILWYRTEALY